MKKVYGARKDKWEVYGEYGDKFTNLDDAKSCAREASKTSEHDYKASVWNIQDGLCYIEYENGKLVRDGWSLPMKRTGHRGSFLLDGKVVEKPIYLLNDKPVIKHKGTVYNVGNYYQNK